MIRAPLLNPSLIWWSSKTSIPRRVANVAVYFRAHAFNVTFDCFLGDIPLPRASQNIHSLLAPPPVSGHSAPWKNGGTREKVHAWVSSWEEPESCDEMKKFSPKNSKFTLSCLAEALLLKKGSVALRGSHTEHWCEADNQNQLGELKKTPVIFYCSVLFFYFDFFFPFSSIRLLVTSQVRLVALHQTSCLDSTETRFLIFPFFL